MVVAVATPGSHSRRALEMNRNLSALHAVVKWALSWRRSGVACKKWVAVAHSHGLLEVDVAVVAPKRAVCDDVRIGGAGQEKMTLQRNSATKGL